MAHYVPCNGTYIRQLVRGKIMNPTVNMSSGFIQILHKIKWASLFILSDKRSRIGKIIEKI